MPVVDGNGMVWIFEMRGIMGSEIKTMPLRRGAELCWRGAGLLPRLRQTPPEKRGSDLPGASLGWKQGRP